MASIFEIKGLDKHFGGIHVTRDITFGIEEGELSAIIGPNGAGKTTLFNLITGFIKADKGEIFYKGNNITGKSPEFIARLGIVRSFQVSTIFADETVFDNVFLASLSFHKKNKNFYRNKIIFKDAILDTEAILNNLKLDSKKGIKAFELSHGDQKVLDIAIALAMKPTILLMDEPTSGMSPDERVTMKNLLKRLHSEFGITIVFIEHDMDMVMGIAQKVRVLVQGQLVAEDSPEVIMQTQKVIDAYLGEEGF
ncbi:MAG: ABC transporter ATP-binding protein [Thermodesulfovibrionales bacterium]|nr:ABC transporter ATP-binding protein [Thermodesulfovibrionales bacterium]